MFVDYFKLEKREHIGIITFDRPPVNAINLQCQHEIRSLVEMINSDSNIYAVIFQAGVAARGFCAGIDIKENQDNTIEGNEAKQAENLKTIAALQNLEVPLITATRGFVLGFGVAILACSDIIICADDTVVGVPEARLGHVGATATISSLVPARVARYLSFTGNSIGAEDLVRYGSALKAVPREQLLDEAIAVANDIVRNYTKTIRFLKKVYNKYQDYQIPERSFTERAYAVRLLADPNREECVKAFWEKRPPKFESNPCD